MSGKYTLAALLGTPPSERDAKALQFIEEMTENADAVQKDVLAEILSRNAETEYLRSFNLDGATDRKTFRSRIPVVTYEDLSPWIRRIADGDTSPILTALPVDQFILSSGTSAGQQKLLPTVEGDWERHAFAFELRRPIMNKYMRGQDQGKALDLRFIRPETKTPGGNVVNLASAKFYKTMRQKNVLDYEPNTSPDGVIVCADFFQSMYAQLVCGLYARDQVVRIGATFGSTLVQAVRLLQQNWQQMVHDIRTGSLSPRVTDVLVRECMSSVMRPDPVLADLIAAECAKDTWEGIIPRIWPDAEYLDAIVTGSMAQYVSALDLYGGGLPIVCSRYLSSECIMGVNLNPMCKPTEVSYTIIPNMAYFEFLPEEPGSGSSDLMPVDLEDVELGKEYEVVITTYAGLYRYRMDDILRVTSFHNSVPQFQFVRRRNVVLSVDLEKTGEADLRIAIGSAAQVLRKFDTSAIEYTSIADITTTPGHYVIFWELLIPDAGSSVTDSALEECCLVVEKSLSPMYRTCRTMNKTIGPLEIRIVKSGTFEELMNYAVSRGASASQYKVPRCVRDGPLLNLLNSRVISKHFAPAHWCT